MLSECVGIGVTWLDQDSKKNIKLSWQSLSLVLATPEASTDQRIISIADFQTRTLSVDLESVELGSCIEHRNSDGIGERGDTARTPSASAQGSGPLIVTSRSVSRIVERKSQCSQGSVLGSKR